MHAVVIRDGQLIWEERADLVYAIKIRVPNPNGALKIGMPADVQFVAGGQR